MECAEQGFYSFGWIDPSEIYEHQMALVESQLLTRAFSRSLIRRTRQGQKRRWWDQHAFVANGPITFGQHRAMPFAHDNDCFAIAQQRPISVVHVFGSHYPLDDLPDRSCDDREPLVV